MTSNPTVEPGADRFRRIQEQIRDQSQPTLSREDIEFIHGILMDYENAIGWGTDCTNCAHLLDQSYADYVARERMEIALTSVRAQLVEARQPHPFFPSDFNVRRNGNRLTAYTQDEASVPNVGDTIIVGVLSGPPGRETAGTAVLARVHAVRITPAPEQPEDQAQTHMPPTPTWAIEVDWAREHDW